MDLGAAVVQMGRVGPAVIFSLAACCAVVVAVLIVNQTSRQDELCPGIHQLPAVLIVAKALGSYATMAPMAAWMIAKAYSRYHLKVAWYVLYYSCMTMLGDVVSYFYQCTDELGASGLDISFTFQALATTQYVGGLFLIQERLQMIETSSLRDFGATRAFWLLCAWSVAVLLFCVLGFYYDTAPELGILIYVGAMLLWTTIFFLFLGMVLAYQALAKASRDAPDDMAESALLAKRLLLRSFFAAQLAALLWPVGAFCYNLDWGYVYPFEKTSGTFRQVVLVLRQTFSWLDILGTGLFALDLSGAFSPATKGNRERAIKSKRQQSLRRAAAVKVHESHKPETKLWDAKVEELAQRGLRLDNLLKFYRKLPEVMPHFNPEKSTTNDVVRGAIIPLSAAKRSSMVEVLQEARRTRAERMVTHQWGSQFRDLVAAVVADALGEHEYNRIAVLLEQDIGVLEHWLQTLGVASKTYWICAFAVNQHKGICGGNPQNDVDTVTGRLFTLCNCGLKKAWNQTEPVMPDGRSIECEMNKFDEMMRELAVSDPEFQQVVVVDDDFRLFKRAWCVAELAEANATGMEQCLKLWSAKGVNDHVEELKTLRIQDMQASRPEDKEEILSRISDPDAFNDTLRHLLIHDLIPAWNTLDSEKLLTSVGRVLRWDSVSLLDKTKAMRADNLCEI